MKKILKIFLISIAVMLIVFLILALLGPKEMKLERSVVIEAPKALIRENIVDFNKMRNWSPWAEIDTAMEYTVEGKTGEVGSVYYWNGNDEVGEGSMEIISTEEDEIQMKLMFIRPFESTSNVWFELENEENGIEVTWGFEGKNSFPMRAFALFMSFEEMLGEDYQKGLNKLKIIAENQAEALNNFNSEIPEVQELDLPEKLYVAKRDVVDETESRTFIDETTEAAEKKLVEQQLDASLPKASVFYISEEEKVDLAAGKSVAEEVEIDEFELIKLEQGKVLKMLHTGSYETIEGAYITLMNYQNLKGYTSTGIIVEEYLINGATEKDTTQWKTAVYMYVE